MNMIKTFPQIQNSFHFVKSKWWRSLQCTVGEKWGSGLVTGLKSSERLKKVIYGYKNNNNPQKTQGIGGFRVFYHFWVLWRAQMRPKQRIFAILNGLNNFQGSKRSYMGIKSITTIKKLLIQGVLGFLAIFGSFGGL